MNTIQELEDKVGRLQHHINVHHNYYKCIARSVHEARLASIRGDYRDLLKMALLLIHELKDQNAVLPVEMDAFEELATELWSREMFIAPELGIQVDDPS